MPKLRRESDAREPQQHIARVHFVTMKVLGHPCAGNRADDDGQERTEFDDAVAPGQALLGQQFRQQAVLRRPKQRGLRRHQRQRHQRKRAASASPARRSPAASTPISMTLVQIVI